MKQPLLSQRVINSTQNDAQAFFASAETDRRNFIGRLLQDPNTVAYRREVVQWLYEALQHESIARQRDRDERITRSESRAAESLRMAEEYNRQALADSKQHGYLYILTDSDDGHQRTEWVSNPDAYLCDVFPGADPADSLEVRPCYLDKAPAPKQMPKSKALVKQAKMIARLADALSEIVASAATELAQDDAELFRRLFDQWRANHATLIEAAKDGD